MPVSLGIALFMTELAPRRVRPPIIFLIDLMAAVPSVVFGLWGFETLSAPLGRVYGAYQQRRGGHSGPQHLLPRESRAQLHDCRADRGPDDHPDHHLALREVFSTVPTSLKEASLALGATRWEMIRASVLGYSRNGVVGSVMLGLGRAMGETIAVALVIGSIQQISAHLFVAGDSLAAVIANQFGESTNQFGASGHVPFQAALIGLGFALFVITIIVNILARSVIARGERGARGGVMAAVANSIRVSTVSKRRRVRNAVMLGLIVASPRRGHGPAGAP